ncbi:hypothetical protein [Vibrio splendidus]|uniref:hypothetical protein n=1 Tax=Vibrio splendidus TaxID=29497 RepID=UPI002469A2BC|nr:hypothetical protein [Vibrio splendidus]MDH5932779.1 hypothetical protein [Vibrio splendidus]
MLYSKTHGLLSFSPRLKHILDGHSQSEDEIYHACRHNWKEICHLSATDALTLSEYFRAQGSFSRYHALLRIAKYLYPDDVRIAVSWSHYVSRTKSPLAAINYLTDFQISSDEHRQLLQENIVKFYSEIGFISEAKALSDQVQNAKKKRIKK